MLDIAIVGGGLCGLALARGLNEQGRSFDLFEARTRPGGRILSVPVASGRARLDLGPAWFWPQSHPMLTQLIEALRLHTFEQYDQGTVLSLEDPEKPPVSAAIDGVHGGARRVTDGMASLTDALIAALPASHLHVDHVLKGLVRREDHVDLHFEHGNRHVVLKARHVVLALPPRLVAEHVSFEPALDAEAQATLLATPTWMAAQAKGVIHYEQPAWRRAKQSGSAFVRHEQATFREVFDACDASGTLAALGGFIALSPARRRDFRIGLPMLMSNQMAQLFGAGLHEREQAYQDWAAERYTCSSRDRDDFSATITHSSYGLPALRRPTWGGRVYFGGSETATESAGYLEGALNAARRIAEQLTAPAIGIRDTTGAVTHAAASATPAAASYRNTAPLNAVDSGNGVGLDNAALLEQFGSWVRSRQDVAFDHYRRHINASLATQQREQLAQRAALDAMEQTFRLALAQLESLRFDLQDVPVHRGRSALTPQVQSAFGGFIERLMEDVARFNGTSCALSSFEGEHHLSRDYEQAILRDIAAAWREFSLAANSVLLDKTASVSRPQEGARFPVGVPT